jgi:transposase
MCGKHNGRNREPSAGIIDPGISGPAVALDRRARWLNRSRRLSKDFEALPETTEAWIRIAMIQLMIRRLAAKK